MLASNEYDRLGYYEVNGQRFLSKTLAWFESTKVGKPVTYNYNNNVFDTYDWTKEPEPSVSIEEYYKRRAEQIRNKYEYVTLLYSGGPDSQTVLDTFLKNNIKIDEIINVNSFEKTQKVNGTTHNADYVYNVKPTVEEIIKKYGNQIRVTVIDEIDMTQKIFKEYYDKGDYYELLFNSGSFPSVWMMRGIWIKHVPHIWSKFLEGKRVCVMMGVDKTSINIEGGRYFTSFSDFVGPDAAMLMTNDVDFKGHNVMELFYHTPDFPELIIKQAHLLKRFVDADTTTQEHFEDVSKYTPYDFRPASNCKSKKHIGNLKYQHYHKVVYPSWLPGVVTPKPMYFGTRLIDCWWINDLRGVEGKVWTSGLIEHHTNFNFIEKKHHILNSATLPFTPSKRFYLE